MMSGISNERSIIYCILVDLLPIWLPYLPIYRFLNLWTPKRRRPQIQSEVNNLQMDNILCKVNIRSLNLSMFIVKHAEW